MMGSPTSKNEPRGSKQTRRRWPISGKSITSSRQTSSSGCAPNTTTVFANWRFVPTSMAIARMGWSHLPISVCSKRRSMWSGRQSSNCAMSLSSTTKFCGVSRPTSIMPRRGCTCASKRPAHRRNDSNHRGTSITGSRSAVGAPDHRILRLSSLISTTCRVSWPKFMNKSAFQPLPVLLRAEPNDARGTSHSAMILRVIATLGTLFALGGTVVLCLVAFNAFPPKTLESKVPVGFPVPNLPATKVSPTDAADQENAVGMPATKTNQADRAVTADDHSTIDQTPAPALNPNSPPAAVTSASDRELLNEQRPEAAGQATLDRQFSESSRKALEKKRRVAERRRALLEKRYQEHAISSEAYKKGQENYRIQIDRYRREMSVYRGPDNQVGQD